ncbi:MAG: hypothetical protein FJX47_21845, partial [Alphaproteobacteria bacterium]|nr:hypothetical protein [Alphaproteobacteria bacterium]
APAPLAPDEGPPPPPSGPQIAVDAHNRRGRAGPRIQDLSQHKTLVSEESEDWVITYMDMVTLLLTVFLVTTALLFLNQRPQENAPTTIEKSEPKAGTPLLPHMPRSDRPARRTEADMLLPTPPPDESRLRQGLDLARKIGALDVEVSERHVVLTIRDQILFPVGSADLSAPGKAMLKQLADVFALMPGQISVEGHTDNVPIATAKFPSNWELSSARAAAVVRALIEAGTAPDRLRATGYAETRPVAANADIAGRARNRRVAFSIEP